MGHIRLGSLPRTRNWQEVVALIQLGAGAAQVANAAIRAAEAGLGLAGRDPGVVETVWLLAQLPHAARADDFHAALYECGVTATSSPGPVALVAACTAAVDDRLANNRGRTDLGEMAQMAAAETLTRILLDAIPSLFAAGPEDVRTALAGLHAPRGFSYLVRCFFGRLTFKALDYFLSRAL